MITAATEALVITMQADIQAELTALANWRRWPVLVRPSVSQLLRELRRNRPRIIVIYVAASPLLVDLLMLISLLHERHPETPMVAVAATENHELESAVRHAGANSYLGINQLDRQLDFIFGSLLKDVSRNLAQQYP